MPLPRGLPVVDHHCHLSPSGEGVAAAARFRSAGGTHLFLATQNYAGRVPTTVEEYRDQFETTERLARQVREGTGVVVYPVVAPYPIDLVHAAPLLGVEPALAVHRTALDLAGRWVRERRAVALGEVGRPHFPVSDELAVAATEAFRHALHVAKEVGCPAVVHSADLDAAGVRALADEGRRAGLRPGQIVKHYARSRFAPGTDPAVVPSYLARRELVREVVGDPSPWFLETDFLDDPARPGAVLDLATVPRRASAIAAAGTAERLWTPFVDAVERVYGWRPEVDGGGPP
ncbi:MAG TPA: TatD family hydrolase [Thermoplasmata archaeon]|nr:TatD family hydrolase [Thermoplasmata archaeon]